MHGHASKQYIFWSYNTSTFSVYFLIRVLSHTSVQNKQNKKQNKKEEKKKEEKKTKKAEMLMGFKFRIFIGHFQMTSWQ